MRLTPLVSAALVLSAALLLLAPGRASGQVLEQDPISYVSKADYFSIDFPGEPKVTEITYPDEYRITLPGRVYTSNVGKSRYTVTVIDYRDAQKIHAARNVKCFEEAGANKPGLTAQQRTDAVGDACQDEGVKDIRGAMMFAAWNIVQKSAKVTHLAYYNSDLIEGYEVHVNNPDDTKTYAVIHMYENRLYIAEANVPKNAPAANWFQISIQFLDEQFKPVRYSYSGLQIYSNGYPKPPRAGQGGQGGQGGRGAPGGQGAQGQGQPAR